MSAIGQGRPAETQLVLERRIAELEQENADLRRRLESIVHEITAIRDTLK